MGEHIVIADSDEEALAIMKRGHDYLHRVLMRPQRDAQRLVIEKTRFFGEGSTGQLFQAKLATIKARTVEESIEAGSILCGSPQSVVKQMKKIHGEVGNGVFSLNFKVGDVPEGSCATEWNSSVTTCCRTCVGFSELYGPRESAPRPRAQGGVGGGGNSDSRRRKSAPPPHPSPPLASLAGGGDPNRGAELRKQLTHSASRTYRIKARGIVRITGSFVSGFQWIREHRPRAYHFSSIGLRSNNSVGCYGVLHPVFECRKQIVSHKNRAHASAAMECSRYNQEPREGLRRRETLETLNRC